MAFPFSSPVARSGGAFPAVRLLPGDDLIARLRHVPRDAGIRATAVVTWTCVGSLCAVRIRHADADQGTRYEGRFEIVSLTGTMDPGQQRLHISVADPEGRVFGGHLLPGSKVHATAGIVALALPELSFGRALRALGP